MVTRTAACAVLLAACAAGGCALRAQEHSEVQSARVPGATLEQRQRRTGVAYRSLQQVRYERQLAEQDYVNAKAAYDRARLAAEELKRETDIAGKAYAAAQARERAAEQEYERGMRSVDEIYGSGAKNDPRPR